MDIVILDTEYTTWEGALQRMWSGPNEERELVQISGIRVSDFKTLNGTKFFSVFTKPCINPELSDYFIDLTGIKQKDIEENGIAIEEGIKRFSDFSKNSYCLCWGDDVRVLEKNLSLINSAINLGLARVADIRNLFNVFGIETSIYNSGTISNFSDTESIIQPGKNHNALSDCISILSAINKLQSIHGSECLNEAIINLPRYNP